MTREYTDHQFEILKEGYTNAFDEIQNSIAARDALFTLALTGIGLSVGGLAFQVASQGQFFLIIGVYALSLVWTLLSLRWSRFNKKISEKVEIRRQIERELNMRGAELMAVKSPPTGLLRSARLEMGFLNGFSYLAATLAWIHLFPTNTLVINVACGTAAITSLIISIYNVVSLYHDRTKKK